MTALLNLRKAAGLSQEYVAQKLGVTQGAISQWESGKVSPQMDKLPQLAKLFGCSIDDLFGQKETPPEAG